MGPVRLIAVLSTSPAARAAWVEAGPERGHVLHAAVCADATWVATRVGVERADPGLSGWTRDPRFPPEVRRLACGPDGAVYAAPAGQIWRVGERADLVRFFATATDPVDLCVTGSGALLAALRGAEAGVLRVVGDEQRIVLSDVDPWRLAARGSDVLLGTVDGGAWLSRDDGATFARILPEGGVSAVAWVGEEAWIGLADGRLLAWRDGEREVLPAPPGGYVTGVAAIPGGALVSTQDTRGGGDALLLWDGARLRPVPLAADEDGTRADWTGAWPRADGSVLIGSFRTGPLVFAEGRLRPARAGFRATVTGGAAMDTSGRLVLALMGTGVYATTDGAATWRSPPGHGRPVTDSVEVVADGEAILVVDFEGVTRLDAAGTWTRLPRVAGLRPGETLVSAAPDANDRLWALDRLGRLFLLEGEAWRPCRQRGLRIDGAGADLLLAARDGFLAPTSCDEAWVPVVLDKGGPPDALRARAAGGWVAAPGTLWKEGKARFALPPLGVTALAVAGDEALVALEDGQVLACAERCEALPERAPGPIRALGRFPDGRVWVAEQAGTLLVEGDGPGPPPWSTVRDARRVTGDLMPLERAPWDDEAGGAPQPAKAPGPGGAPGPTAPPPGEGPPAHGCGASDHLVNMVFAGLVVGVWLKVRQWWRTSRRRPPR